MNFKRMHSSSVVIDDNGVLILGDSGSGKSDLALRLIDNGATLISDDISICRKNLNNIYLYCPPEIKGCLLYTSPSPRDGSISRMPSSA